MDIEQFHKSDIDFLNYLENKNADALSNDYSVFQHYLIDSSGTYYKQLLDLFSTSTTIYSNSIVHSILSRLVNKFSNAKDIRVCSPDMFSESTIDLLVKHKLFFKRDHRRHSVFETLMLSKTYIDYFNIELYIDHKHYYLPIANNYYKRLLDYTNNYSVVDMDYNDFTDIVNYISLVISLVEKKEDEYEMLIDSHYKLYTKILDVILQLNKLYTRFLSNPNYMCECGYSYSSSKLSQMIYDIEIPIKQFTNSNLFFKKLLREIDTKLDNNNLDDIAISLISLLTDEIGIANKQTYSKIEKGLKHILLDAKYSIYDKIQFILNCNYKIFTHSIESLCTIYRDIEKYNEYSGFSEKNHVREKIVSIVNNYIIHLDNISDCLKEDIYITISNYLVLLLEKIVKIKNLYDTKYFKNPLKHSQNILMSLSLIASYLNMIWEHYNVLNRIYSIRETINPIIIAKIVETNYNIIKNSVAGRLYTYLEMFKDIDGINCILPVESQKNIEKFLTCFFINIESVLENHNIKDYYRNNPNFLSNSDLEATKTIVGCLYIESVDINVSNLVDKLVDIIAYDRQIYIEDIPEKYIDPLLMVPIENPVECPCSKTLVDRVSILNHLVFSETDPFTNLPLTKEELLTHNNKPDVLARLALFTQEFNSWKASHKVL